MRRYVKPALAYLAPVFALAFVLGVLRTLWIAPRIGVLMAVAVEVPLLLLWSWAVAGRVLRRWPLPLPDRIAMGVLSFALLMLAEAGLALATGQTLSGFLGGMVTPAGALGLAGQLGFAALPALRVTWPPRAARVRPDGRRSWRRWARPRR
ncbi:hypothetical protein [Neotabrizicola sp. sgz301269]|uniref:hypothetical protein n=1 Tax=Neotabrizicola sp. sgz301269 TaxID=3276282 RepID=UPI0037700C81